MTQLHDVIAAQMRRRIPFLGYTATIRVPMGGVDSVGQPSDGVMEYPNVPAHLSTPPHPARYAAGRVEEETDWRWLYIPDDAGVVLGAGCEVEVYTPNGASIGVFEVVGDVAHRPGHYRAKVKRSR